MAMTSASFMGIGGYGSALISKLDKIDCSQILSAILKSDRELLGHIKMGPPARNIEVSWIEDELNAVVFSAATSVSTSVSLGAAVYTSAQVDRWFASNMLIAPRDGEEIYQITGITGCSALTVALYSTGGHATHSTTGEWIIISKPYSDIDAASSDISATRTKRRNFTQVFERAIEITQTRKGMDMEAIVDELQYQIKQRTLEIKRELDIAVILSQAYWDGTYKTGTTEIRTMQGIINFIRDYDNDATNEDTMVTNTNGALTLADVNGLCYKIWDAGGLDESSDPIIVVGAKQQRVIASFEKELRRVEQGERQVGYYRDVFLSDMGKEFPVVLDRWFPPDKLLILDRSRVSLRALQGDDWHMEKMAKTGRSEKWQLSGQYTIEVRNPEAAHGLLYNLT